LFEALVKALMRKMPVNATATVLLGEHNTQLWWFLDHYSKITELLHTVLVRQQVSNGLIQAAKRKQGNMLWSLKTGSTWLASLPASLLTGYPHETSVEPSNPT
jgi:hypothetical protein